MVTGGLWVKVSAVEMEQKLAWEKYRTKVEGLEKLIESLKDPLIT
jgi:hypothetical protein